MRVKGKLRYPVLLALSALFSTPLFAAGTKPPPNDAFFSPLPLPPRATFWGLTGEQGSTAKADVMVPLIGSPNQILYTDVQGKYGTADDWFSGIAVGYRQIVHSTAILGAYVFADHDETSRHSSFWFVSPGVEALGRRWDARVNGYFPVTARVRDKGSFFGDQLGISRDVSFQGHKQFDNLFDVIESVGPGVDGEVGYQPFAEIPFKAYVGGYYFSPKEAENIKGVAGRLAFHFNRHISLSLLDSYDNLRHNTFAVRIGFTLGGVKHNTVSPTLSQRMLDPITRNLATLNQGIGEPVVKSIADRGNRVLERDNIWFFNAQGGQQFNAANGEAQCTFEHPCAGSEFDQANINAINGIVNGVNFYFNPGTYGAAGDVMNIGLALNTGQSLFGRTQDYKLPAIGNQRPLFEGGLDLPGNNSLNSIRLQRGSTEVTTGIIMNNALNVVINKSEIGDPNFAGETEYVIGISADNGSNLTLNHSTVTANANGMGGIATGIDAENVSTVTLNHSRVTANANGTGGEASGIDASTISTVTLNHSRVTANANGMGGVASGISAFASIATLNHSSVTANANGMGGGASGISASGSTVTSNHSSVTANANGPNGQAIGISAAVLSAVNLNKGSRVFANATTSSNAIVLLGGSTLNNDGTSRCFENGTQVPCT